MANRDNPNGFRMAAGIGNQHVVRRFPVAASNGTAIFVGDVIDHNGTTVVPAAADAGVSVVGVCVAVFDTNQVPCGHPLAAVSTKYLTASTAGYIDVALALPGAIFIGQAQTGQTPAQVDIGATTDHVQGTGDTTTAQSRHELNFSDLNTGLQCRIIGLVDNPLNTYAEHADLYFMFNESMFMNGPAGV